MSSPPNEPGQWNPRPGDGPNGGDPASTGGFPAEPGSQSPPPSPGSTGGFPAQPGNYPPPTGDQPAQGGGYPPPTGDQPAQAGGFPPPTGDQPVQAGGYPPPPPSGYGPGTGGISPQGGPAAPRKKSKKPWLIGGGVLVVVAALVIGFLVFRGFGGIENGKGEIKNAAAFLTDTKAQWEEELPTDGIEVSDKAGCYYILNDRDEITNEVACGPARRASSGDGEVWDVYHFSVSGSGDNQTASEPGALKTGQKAPSGDNRLVTAEGDEPADDGLSLKEPPLPRAEENGIWTGEEYTVDPKATSSEVDLVDDPRLVGPSGEVTIDSIAEVDAAMLDEQLMQAAEGQKFLLITLSGSSGPVYEYADNEVLFDIDGEQVDTGLDPASIGTTELLVSVSADGDSALVLDSDGHQQTLDLADGARADDPATALYYTDDPEPETTIDQTLTYPAQSSSTGETFGLEVGLLDGQLAPYDSDQGWAPDGLVWLTFEFVHQASQESGTNAYESYLLDCTMSAIDSGSIHTCGAVSGGTGAFLAAVPAGTTSFTVNLTFRFTGTGTGLPDTLVIYPGSDVSIAF